MNRPGRRCLPGRFCLQAQGGRRFGNGGWGSGRGFCGARQGCPLLGGTAECCSIYSVLSVGLGRGRTDACGAYLKNTPSRPFATAPGPGCTAHISRWPWTGFSFHIRTLGPGYVPHLCAAGWGTHHVYGARNVASRCAAHPWGQCPLPVRCGSEGDDASELGRQPLHGSNGKGRRLLNSNKSAGNILLQAIFFSLALSLQALSGESSLPPPP
jgi:hypothetical protein